MCLSKQGMPVVGKFNIADALTWKRVIVEESAHWLSKREGFEHFKRWFGVCNDWSEKMLSLFNV